MADISVLSYARDDHVGEGKRYFQHSPEKVALVCMGPSVVDFLTATLTQEFDPEWVNEVWTINMSANCFKSDLVFWMDDLIEQEKFRPNLFKALRQFGYPVMTTVRRPEVVPNSYDYPIEDIARMAIPVFGKPYLNNAVAMAIAYALYKGVKAMAIYGADFTYPNRNFAESGRACVEAWITLASMKGMNIQLCSATSLMDSVADHGIYGYVDQPAIKLADGRIFQYRKAEGATVGKYIPQDSSGKEGENVDPDVPGVQDAKRAAGEGN